MSEKNKINDLLVFSCKTKYHDKVSTKNKIPHLSQIVNKIGLLFTGKKYSRKNKKIEKTKDHLRTFLKKFDADEVEVLKKVYNELSSRSPGRVIDKATFLEYFPLPGLWGERLFQRFDYKNDGVIDYEEFLIGIALCSRGTRYEKIKVLFQVFDLNGDGVLQKNELVTMLSNLPNLFRYIEKSDKKKKKVIIQPDSISVDNSTNTSSIFKHITLESSLSSRNVNSTKDTFISDYNIQSYKQQNISRLVTTGNKPNNYSPTNKKKLDITLHTSEKEEPSLSSSSSPTDATNHTCQRYNSYSDIHDSINARDQYDILLDSDHSPNDDQNSDNDFFYIAEKYNNTEYSYYNKKNNVLQVNDSVKTHFNGHCDLPLDIVTIDSSSSNSYDCSETKPIKNSCEKLDEKVNQLILKKPDKPSDFVYNRNNSFDVQLSGLYSKSKFGSHRFLTKDESNCKQLDYYSEKFSCNKRIGLQHKHHSKNSVKLEDTFCNKPTVNEENDCKKKYSKNTESIDNRSNLNDIANDHYPRESNFRSCTSLPSIEKSEIDTMDIEALVDQIIEECEFSDCDSITFVEFKTWLERNDMILAMFTNCLHEEAWGLQGNALYRRSGKNTHKDHTKANQLDDFPINNDFDSVALNRGIINLRPDTFYKVKRLFTVPFDFPYSINNSEKHECSSIEVSKETVKDYDIHTHDSKQDTKAKLSNNSIPLVYIADTDEKKIILSDNNNDKNSSNLGIYGDTLISKHNSNTTKYETIQNRPLKIDPVSINTKTEKIILNSEKNQIYPRQSRDILNSQLLNSIAASFPDINMNSLITPSNIGNSRKLLACPNCGILLVVCPVCQKRLLSLKLTQGTVIIECVSCLNNSVNKFRSCWHCQWDFVNVSKLVDQCEPLCEGELYKIGRRTHKWKKRYFVLVDNLLYYYNKKEDSKPRGFFFLEGCFIEPYKGKTKKKFRSKSEAKNDTHPESDSVSPLCNKIKKFESSLDNLHVESAKTGGKYGFSIIHGSNKIPQRNFFAKSFDEWELWMKSLRHVINQQRVEEVYQFQDSIGQGKFSIVYRAIERDTNQEVAVKVIDKAKISLDEKELLRSEVGILRVLRHEHVINLYDIIDDKTHIYIIMEYVKGGELYDLIAEKVKLPEPHVNRIIFQLLSTVAYLHKCGIIHRDLKPENILLTDTTINTNIKITDFGLSCICGPNDIMTQPCGTLAYAAPEILTLKGYNHKVDLWSVGVIMYLLFFGRLPFPINNLTEVSAHYQPSLSFMDKGCDHISSSAKDLLRKLLNVMPEKRISAEEALQHIWLKNPTAVISDYFYDSTDRNISSQICYPHDLTSYHSSDSLLQPCEKLPTNLLNVTAGTFSLNVPKK